jgi:hypothetical protein
MGKFLQKSFLRAQEFLILSRGKTNSRALIVAMSVCILAVANVANAQVTVTASAGAATGNYTTLQMAVDSINWGVHQGAISVTLPAAGSETNATGTPITLNGTGIGAASYTSVSITATSYTVNAGAGTATPASAAPDGIFVLNGADNVTITGVTFNDPNTLNPATAEFGVGLFKASGTDGCQNNSITGCTINMRRVNNVAGTLPMPDGSTGILMVNSTLAAATVSLTNLSAAGGNSNNTFASNTINDGNNGIALMGFSAGALSLADANNTVGGASAANGNTILNFGGGAAATVPTHGIRLNNMWDATVRHNTINNNNGTGVNHVHTVRGIYAGMQPNASITISNNTVTLKNGAVGFSISGIETAVAAGATAAVGAAGSSIAINNNTVTGCAVLQGTTAVTYLIFNNNLVPAVTNMYGNNMFANTSAATTGATWMISDIAAVGHNATSVTMNNNTIGNGTGSATAGMFFNGTAAYTGAYYGLTVQRTNATTNATMPDLNWNYNNCENAIQHGTTISTGIVYHYFTGTTIPLTTPGTGTFWKVARVVGNHVKNTLVNHTGTTYGFYLYNTGGHVSVNVDSNTVDNYRKAATAAATGIFYGMYGLGYYCAPNIPVSFTYNRVINCNFPTAGTSTHYGIFAPFFSTGNAPRVTYNNNIVNNNFFNSTGIFYGQYYYSFGAGLPATGSSVINNQVRGNKTASGTWYGMFLTSTSSTSTIPVDVSNNIIDQDSTTGASGNIFGLYISSTPIGGYNVHHNNITQLVSTGTTGPLGTGLYSSLATPAITNIYNNEIGDFRFPSTAPAVFSRYTGMNLLGSGAHNVRYNTIRLDSAGIRPAQAHGATGIQFGATLGSALTLQNNIINANILSSGTLSQVSAVRRSATGTANVAPPTSGSTTSANFNANNNIYYVPSDTNNFAYVEGTSVAALVNGFKLYDGTSATGTVTLASNLVVDSNFNSNCGLYKKFLGAPRESATFTENNLTVAVANPVAWVPAGASLAESGALAITSPFIINTDYTNAARGPVADIGAIEFAGTANDLAGPAISFTVLPNSICDNNPVINATITDPSGVLTSPKPRLYYKKSTNANVLPATNDLTTDGWKFVESINVSSPFSFSMDYTKLFSTGGVTTGDVIQYFFVAQDNTAANNFGASAANFPTTYCPDTTDLPITAFPVTNTASFTILPQPSLVTTVGTPSTLCGSGTTTLTLSGGPFGGATFQWQVLNTGGSYVNIPGAIADSFVTSLTTTSTFRCEIRCNGTQITPGSPSAPVTVNVYNPLVANTVAGSRCGVGPVCVDATPSSGSTIAWYANATSTTAADTVLFNGNQYCPILSSTTTLYAAAQSPLGSHTMGLPAPPVYYSNINTAWSQEIQILNPAGAWLDSVDMYFNNTTAGNVQINLYNGTGSTLIHQGPVTSVIGALGTAGVANPASRKAVPIGKFLPPGTYRLSLNTAATTAQPWYNFGAGLFNYPYNTATPNIARVNGSATSLTGALNTSYYNWFYKHYLRAACESSPRLAVIATINPPPAVTTTSSAAGTICVNSVFTLTASSTNTGYTYVWNPGAISGATPAITATSSQIYTVTATDNSGGSFNGCAATATVAITTFAPPPLFSLSTPNTSVCAGGTATITATDSSALVSLVMPTGYCASQASSTADEDIFNVSFAGQINQSSTCGTTGGPAANGLPASALSLYSNYSNVQATVARGATVPISVTLGYCGTFAYTNSAAAYIDFNRNGVLTDPGEQVWYKPGGALPLAGQTFTSTVTIPVTAALGRTLMRVVYWENSINPPAVCGTSSSWGEVEDYSVVIGYQNSPATSWSWSSAPSSTITPANSATVTASGITATTIFTATATDANGCTSSQTLTINVGPMVCNAVTTSKDTVCACAPVTLSASASGGGAPYIYEWTNSSGAVIGINPTVTVSPCSTSTYTVKIKSGDPNCTDSCTTSFTQQVAPPVTMTFANTAGGPIQICGNNQTSVSVTATPASNTYVFSGATPLPTGTNPFTFSPLTTTVYTVTATNSNLCTATSTLTITYQKRDTIQIVPQPGPNVCVGSPVTLSVTDTVSGPSVAPFYCTPAHNIAGPCLSQVQFGAINNSTGAACTLPSYTTYTNMATVVKNTAPAVTLNLAPTGFAGVWIDITRDGDFIDPGEFLLVVTNNPSGTINFPIPNSAQEGVTGMRVRSSTQSLAQADACTTLPDGETEDYLVRIIRVQTPITSVTWTSSVLNNGTPSFNTTTSNPTTVTGFSGSALNPNQSVFIATVVDANGCTNQTTIGINTAPLAAGTIAANATTRCNGQLLQLTSTPTGGGMPYTYTWAGPGGFTATGQTVSTTAVNTGTVAATQVYTVTITDACSPSASTSTTISITVNPTPAIVLTIGNQPLCGAGSSNMLVAITNGVGGGPLTGSSTITPTTSWSPAAGVGPFSWTPGASTIYTVTSTASNGCTNFTTVSMIYSPPFGVTPSANPTGIGPCGGTVTLTAADTSFGPSTWACTTNNYTGNFASSAADDEIFGFNITGTSLSTVSNCTTLAGPAGSGLPASVVARYSNYVTTATPIPVLYTNTPYSGTMQLSNCSGFGYSMGQAIFVDWNRNCTWDLPGERVFGSTGINAGGVSPASTTVPFTFTIPSAAVPGRTLMRVIVVEGQNGTAITPNTVYTWGETEDYAVDIVSIGSIYPINPLTGYVWRHYDSATATIIIDGSGKTLVDTPATTQTVTCYTVTATNSVGCTGTGSVCITVGPVNCGNVTVWKDTVCYGQCDTLTANPTLGGTPYSYSWSGPGIVGAGNTKKITVCTNTTLTTLDSALYTVTVTDACGLSCSVTKKIYLRPQMPLSIAPNGTDTLCATGGKTLTAGPNNYASYVWTPSAGLSATTGTTVTASPLQHTNYVVTATDIFGCTATASDSITYSPPMFNLVSANPPILGCPDTVCLTILDSSVVMGPQTMPAVNSYGISNASSTFDDEIARVQIVGTILNNASTCATTGGGAANGLPASLINQYSNYTALPAPMLFPGNTYGMQMDLTNCSGFVYSMGQAVFIDLNRNFTWDLPAERVYSSAGINPGNLAPPTTVSFNITIPPSAVSGVTLMRCVVVESTNGTGILPNTTYTWGETEDYLVNIMPGTPPLLTYTNIWNGGNLVNAPGLTVCDSINATTTYTVTATNNYGCTSTNTITVTVGTLACGPVTGPDTVCSGNPFTLTASQIGGGTISSYVWTGCGITTSVNTVTQNITATNTGAAPISCVYDVTLTDACGNTCTAQKTVWIKPSPVPTIAASPAILCGVNTSALTATVANSGGSATNTIIWAAPAGASVSPSSGSLTTTATLPPSGIFSITVTDVAGCTGTGTVLLSYSPAVTVAANANPTNVGCASTVTLTTAPVTVTATYCVPTFGTNQYDDVVNFGVGDAPSNYNVVNNASNCTVPGGPAGNGLPASILNQYSNFTNIPPSSIAINKGSKYHFTYTIDTCVFAGGINYAYAARVFIDLNRDGDFADLGESAYTPATFTAGGHTIVDSFVIDPAAVVVPGVSVMRIVANSTVTPSNILSCGAGMFSGEAEDYLVNLADTSLTYTWTSSVGGNLVSTTGAVVTANPSGQVSYTYTVTASNALGCTSVSSVTINTNPLVLDSVRAKSSTPATAICDGLCDTIRVFASGGSAPYTVTISPAATQLTSTTFRACPNVTTPYTITVTDACNVTLTTAITINVRPKPAITFTPADSVVSCTAPANLTIPAPTCLTCVSQTWNPAGPPGTFNFSGSSTYTVTGLDGFGCTATKTFNVIVNYPHNITSSVVPSAVCYGGTATLNFTDTQLAFGPQTFCATNSYGTSAASSAADDEIRRIEINGTPLNNTSGCAVTGSAGGLLPTPSILNRYSNYTHLTPTPLYAGTAYTGSLDLTNCSGFPYSMGQAIFIDLNRNCAWDLPAERVYGSPGTNSGAVSPAFTNVPFNFTIPTSAAPGVTLMRVVVVENVAGGNILPNNTYSWGETEDYAVNIAANGPATLTSWYWTNGTDTVSNSNPSTTAPITANTVYTLTVTGAGGCTYTKTQAVMVNPQIAVTTTSTIPTCNGFTNGTITSSATGGSGALTSAINPSAAQSGNNFSNVGAGTYTITYTDTLGCKDSSVVSLVDSPEVNATVGFANINACFGDSVATVYVVATGGTPYSGSTKYQITWTDPVGNTLNNPVAATLDTSYQMLSGTYQVYVSDTNGCIDIDTFTVSQPSAPLSISAVVDSNVSCFGGSNGQITVTAAGGTPSYKFSIDGGTQTPFTLTATFAGLTAGTHTLVVTDTTNICTASTTIDITQPTALMLDSITSTVLPCAGDSVSTMTSYVSGGTAPYTYAWSNGGTGATSASNPAGTYTLTVTDAKGCATSMTHTIADPTPVSFASVTITAPSCFGLSNGSVAITGAGGNPFGTGAPYTISPATSGLADGTYTFTLTDANSCTADSAITVLQPDLLVVDSMVVSPTGCSGGANGVATVYVSGGTTNYTYAWEARPTVTVNTVTDYAAGTYTIGVTDANGCTTTSQFAIGQPSAVSATIAIDAAISCFGGNDGQATVTASGGAGGYTYLWNNVTASTTATASNLDSGTYNVTVTDANGCPFNTSVTITEPTQVLFDAISVDSVSCVGLSDGSATATVSGGDGTYTYTWQTPGTGTTNSASGYPAGTFTVSVADGKGCASTSSFTIEEPAAVVATAVVDSNAKCIGASNGGATVSATGGTTPYTYAWASSGGTAASATGLAAGTYTATVTDAYGCTGTSTVEILDPSAVVVTTVVDSNVSCFGGSNGGATASATGGAGSYTFSWAASGGTAASATGLAAGTYTATATDANGCTGQATVVIGQPAAALDATTSFVAPFCVGDATTITVSATGGTAAYSGIGTFTVTTSGTYNYPVTDANGCIDTATAVVAYPDSIEVTSIVATDATCNGTCNGTAAITATGGTVSGSYVITPSTTGLCAGTYVFNIADDNGCSIDTTVTIDEPSAIVITVDSLNSATCGGGNGSYGISAAGGTGTITLDINTSLNVGNPYADPAAAPGTYNVTATDASGCVATTAVVVVANTNTLGVVANASAITTCANTTVYLWGSNTSSNSNVVYTWDNNVTDSVAFVLAGGSTYTFIVSGVDTVTGCGETDTINITSTIQSSQLALATSANAASLAGNSCDLSMQPQGTTIDYIDNTCNLIATVQDANGGNSLGAVNACVYVSGPVQTWNNQPYAARTFNIVPQNNGPAVVTLYYTTDDIIDFNNHITTNGLAWPTFNAPNLPTPSNGDQITNAYITKFSDTLGLGVVNGFQAVTLTYDATNARWWTTFPITSFSYFYLHTTTITAPLAAEVLTFTGRKEGSVDVLDWTTVNEKDMSHFNLVRGATPADMKPLANNIPTKAVNGTSAAKLSYTYTDAQPMVGHNYYQLEAVNINGDVTRSDVVDIYWAVDGAQVVIYPNPALNDLHVDVNIDRATPARIRIYDASGRLVKQIETEFTKGLNSTVVDLGDIASGVYLIKITDNKALNYSQQFKKN